MPHTYRAVLHGNRIEWLDSPPAPGRPVPVQITLLENEAVEPSMLRGQAMARVLEALAQGGGLSTITDPVAWQREVRQDRPLPGRGA